DVGARAHGAVGDALKAVPLAFAERGRAADQRADGEGDAAGRERALLVEVLGAMAKARGGLAEAMGLVLREVRRARSELAGARAGAGREFAHAGACARGQLAHARACARGHAADARAKPAGAAAHALDRLRHARLELVRSFAGLLLEVQLFGVGLVHALLVVLIALAGLTRRVPARLLQRMIGAMSFPVGGAHAAIADGAAAAAHEEKADAGGEQQQGQRVLAHLA